eukprot:GDKJ01054718.1.p1 GENE.GDKJ01054718.1~~GDKJ01054718.1.p1  ORF type:complete len:262 (-),score=14.72 GDKJ01054718.1:18-803(-)
MDPSLTDLGIIDDIGLYVEVNVDSIIDVDPAYLRATESETKRALVGDDNKELIFSPWCERLFAVSVRYPDESVNAQSLTPFVRCLVNVPQRLDFRKSLAKNHEMLVEDSLAVPGSVSCVLRMQIQAEFRGTDAKYIVIQIWELTESGPRAFGESFVPLKNIYLTFARTHPSLVPRTNLKKMGLGVADEFDKLDGVLLPHLSALHYFPVWPMHQKDLMAFDKLRAGTTVGENYSENDNVDSIGRISVAVRIRNRSESLSMTR